MSLPRNSKLDQTFVLQVTTANAHVPRMWVEKDPEDRSEVSTRPSRVCHVQVTIFRRVVSSQACMLTFYPELDFNEKTDNVIIVAIDCSNSMKGETFVNAVKVCLSPQTTRHTWSWKSCWCCRLQGCFSHSFPTQLSSTSLLSERTSPNSSSNRNE